MNEYYEESLSNILDDSSCNNGKNLLILQGYEESLANPH